MTNDPDVEHVSLDSTHIDAATALITKEEGDTYYRQELKRMIEENLHAHYGFGYCSISRHSGSVVAVVFYEGFEMPLTGTPCMLVSDIVVSAEYRRRGIATRLQQFVYGDMQRRGIRWVLGNIDAENVASRRQAEKLDRIAWAHQVLLHNTVTNQ